MGLQHLYTGYRTEQKMVQEIAGFQFSTGSKAWQTLRLLVLSLQVYSKQSSTQVDSSVLSLLFQSITTVFQ